MDSVIKETGFSVSQDSEKVYYETRGQGREIIFCYGVGCLFNHWLPQVKHFSKNHKTVLFDYRGHHGTPIPEDKESLTIDALALDLIALCEHLKIEKSDFVGHSFGALVIMRAYELKPELFRKIIFVNGLYHNPFSQVVQAEKLVEIINHVKKFYNKAPKVLSALWEKGVTNPLLIPLSAITGGFNLSKTALKDIEIYARGISAIDFRVFITFFEGMVAFDYSDRLSKIEVPTLIICGSKDALTPMQQQHEMHELIPNSELYVVPYGSHCTQLDFPEMVNLKIQQFIGNEKN